jgi:hypothetical protein
MNVVFSNNLSNLSFTVKHNTVNLNSTISKITFKPISIDDSNVYFNSSPSDVSFNVKRNDINFVSSTPKIAFNTGYGYIGVLEAPNDGESYVRKSKEWYVLPASSEDLSGRLDNIEQDFAISSVNPAFYKEFSYLNEELIGYKIYTSVAKITELFDVSFIFSSGILQSKSITRKSDLRVLNVIFGYTDGNLTSQTRTIS